MYCWRVRDSYRVHERGRLRGVVKLEDLILRVPHAQLDPVAVDKVVPLLAEAHAPIVPVHTPPNQLPVNVAHAQTERAPYEVHGHPRAHPGRTFISARLPNRATKATVARLGRAEHDHERQHNREQLKFLRTAQRRCTCKAFWPTNSRTWPRTMWVLLNDCLYLMYPRSWASVCHRTIRTVSVTRAGAGSARSRRGQRPGLGR